MSDRANIHVLVDEEQKQRWSNYADSNAEVDNLSQLVRTAVETYISEDESDGGGESEEIRDLIEVVDRTQSTVQTNQNKLLDIESQTLTEREFSALLENEMESLLEDKMADILSQEIDFGVPDERVEELKEEMEGIREEVGGESE
jgi:predicted transcriptional regulator